jgi:hypothetical protein
VSPIRKKLITLLLKNLFGSDARLIVLDDGKLGYEYYDSFSTKHIRELSGNSCNGIIGRNQFNIMTAYISCSGFHIMKIKQ